MTKTIGAEMMWGIQIDYGDGWMWVCGPDPDQLMEYETFEDARLVAHAVWATALANNRCRIEKHDKEGGLL